MIVDTPPSPEAEVLRAVNISDLCLVVARPTALDLAAIRQSTAMIERAGCPGLVVLNQCPPKRDGQEAAQVREALDHLLSAPLPVAGSRLRSRAAYQHAFSRNQAVTEWDPRSEAAADVLRLLGEISDHLLLSASGGGDGYVAPIPALADFAGRAA
jgi:chromosome partitioning protein